jgi:glycosyltransferase involved in cell wall biosynthesis
LETSPEYIVSARVLSVIHGPVYGGAHSQLIRLREPLLARGFDTIALLPEEPGNARGRLDEAGVEVLSLPLHRLRATPDPRTQLRFAASLPGEVAAIRRVLAERHIDLVQVHGPTNPHGAIAARREGIPVVWQLYEMRTPAPLRLATMPLVLRMADVAMSTGRAVARSYPGALRLGERLVTYVPPVDTQEFRPDPQRRAAARAELGLSDGTTAVGTLGNLNPDKGHEFLIRAIADVRQRHPDVRLRILGAHSPAHASLDTKLRSEARRLGLSEGGSIRFVDPGRRAAELLPALDVFVLASRREGIPTVVLEAMACGIPVVTSDVGAVREVVEAGASGLVVPRGDPAALATAVEQLLAEPELRERIAAAGRRIVVERHDLDTCAEAHARAYRRAMEGRVRRSAKAEPVGAP